MASNKQMNRGATQALYKYLPESWIDFYVRGKNRKQYIAKVIRWNSESLDNINAKRLIRKVDELVHAFHNQIDGKSNVAPTLGFGSMDSHLTTSNCDIRTPKISDEERGIVAEISPLTFYCPECMKIYTFSSSEKYEQSSKKCHKCNVELAQFRQIYFCQCGNAVDVHRPKCPVHGYGDIVWDGKYDFYCNVCKRPIHMQSQCKECGQMMYPKNALDPSQFFTYSLSLIDLIDEKLEEFVSETDYGRFIVLAYWLNKISSEELNKIIKDGLVTDEEAYQKVYDTMLKQFSSFPNAEEIAKVAADNACGNNYIEIINEIIAKISTTEENLNELAENILEYDLVYHLKESSTLDDAIRIAQFLDTNSNPESYKKIAEKFGISDAKVCDKIPFISCSYGYTRKESECKPGVQLRALKAEKPGRKNIYATKLNTEGVIFEFDRKKILEWLIKNDFVDSDNIPDLDSDEEIKIWFAENIKPKSIHPFSEIDEMEKETYHVYRLIHSLSHILIRAAAEISGLGKDSLSEYIFPGVPAVLIYCQNSQGFNLGALYNTFEAYFDRWIYNAYDNALQCVFDPVCMERDKACTGCLFLNEVSCRHFNKDLDRSYLIGHVDRETQKRIYGFWEEE